MRLLAFVFLSKGEIQIPYRVDKAMPTWKIRVWFAKGLDMPKGKAGKAEHLKLYREMEAEHR